MHNPFLESPSQLRKEWKSLRDSLTSDQSDDLQLETVLRWWSRSPISKQWLDWDDPKSWPDPWELITTKSLDYSAIALGMKYTLLLNADGRWTADRLQLCLASDADKTFQHLVLIVDQEKVLNASVLRITEAGQLTIHSRYVYDGKTHADFR
jgi:hypothetical protein